MSNTAGKNLILSQPKIGQAPENSTTYLPQTVTHVSGEDTVVTVEIPGVDPSTVEVVCENGVLRVSCPKGEATINIGSTVEVSDIKADILWGLLTLEIPPAPAPTAQAVKVSIHDAVKKAPSKAPVKFTDEEKG
jgi:HSP20 family molecular chaperone IbpA